MGSRRMSGYAKVTDNKVKKTLKAMGVSISSTPVSTCNPRFSSAPLAPIAGLLLSHRRYGFCSVGLDLPCLLHYSVQNAASTPLCQQPEATAENSPALHGASAGHVRAA